MHLVWLLAFAGSSLGRTALAPRSGSGSSTPLKLPGDRVMIAITIICSPVDADGCAIPYPPNEFCMPPHTSCKQDYTYVFNADVPQDKADECRRLCGCSPISNVMRYVCASSLIAVALAAFNGPAARCPEPEQETTEEAGAGAVEDGGRRRWEELARQRERRVEQRDAND
ncbi:hypothetical protein PCL_01056 [Purpureocillium lilacinum]|uniref:Uncharacterized protein n=1 Tax=Purpureocillium lilacinum TaxID=33203 RepID=A0A2U3E4J6_PURLI|nr:hypothetical protein PCL_01056 [Purpureocillium lilacinum]